MDYDIILLACKFNSWCVAPYLHMHQKHWKDGAVTLVAEQEYARSDKSRFVKIPDEIVTDDECPPWFFSDSLIYGLENSPSEYAIVMLADYWLYADVDESAIQATIKYISEHQEVLRIDIGYSTAPSGGVCNMNEVGENIFECVSSRDCFYPTSLTPGLWNKRNYLEILSRRMNPWETERTTCDRFMGLRPTKNCSHMRSLWRHTGPIKYSNSLRGRDNNNLVVRRESIDEVKQYIPPRFTLTFEN
jgi:hypothetical protein